MAGFPLRYPLVACEAPPDISLLFPHLYVALVALQQAHLITSEERTSLCNASGLAGMQCDKSPEVLSKSADILRRHGYTEDAKFLSSKQTKYSSTLPMLCHTVQQSYYYCALKKSIYSLEPLIHPTSAPFYKEPSVIHPYNDTAFNIVETYCQFV